MNGARAGRAATEGGCWPSAVQTQLLRAAVLGGEEARAAWSSWKSAERLEEADLGSQRLFPLLYRNLVALGVTDPELTRLKGIYHSSWYRNQFLLGDAADALRRLDAAGLDTMVLKGVALARLYYRDAGARPMDDVDVLVHRPHAERALAVLAAGGWRPKLPGALRHGLGTVHAVALESSNGRGLDLHWYSLAAPSSDEPFWASSVELEVGGVRTRALSPADQLLHTAVHGARWNAVHPLRWMADAAAIGGTAGAEISWERLVQEAGRRRVTLALAAALEQLVDAIGFSVPPWLLEHLRDAPATPLERSVQRATTRPIGGGVSIVWDRYSRLSRLEPALHLTDFLGEYFRADDGRQLAARLVRRAGRVAWTRLALRALPPAARYRCPECGRVVIGRATAACRWCSAASPLAAAASARRHPA